MIYFEQTWSPIRIKRSVMFCFHIGGLAAQEERWRRFASNSYHNRGCRCLAPTPRWLVLQATRLLLGRRLMVSHFRKLKGQGRNTFGNQA